ncbi:MAG: hypothetical protein ACTSSC_07345 [Promethearchaeota archaeon]
MNELKQGSYLNQVVNNIKEEINELEPSYSRIKTYLTDLQTKEEFQSLSDIEFFNIVGETFEVIPELFMNNRFHSNYLPYSFPKEKRKQMARRIIEKHSLYDGEKILHECDTNIKMVDLKTGRTQVIISVNNGHLIVTNSRIIAQGKLEVVGGRGIGSSSRRDETIKSIMEASTKQELPCYGYEIPINPIKFPRSRKKYKEKPKKRVSYYVKMGDKTFGVSIKLPKMKKEENLDRVYEILSKEVSFPSKTSESKFTERTVKIKVNDKKNFAIGTFLIVFMVLTLILSILMRNTSGIIGSSVWTIIGLLLMLGPSIRYTKKFRAKRDPR